MATARDLVNAVRHALDNYVEVSELEVMNGADIDRAHLVGYNTAIRKAIEEIGLLLEVDSCDL